MTVDLKQYHEQLDQLSPEIRATLDATAIEAGHVMSPAGLKQYLDGAVALARLGRGNDLVISYLQAMPAVVKDLKRPSAMRSAQRSSSPPSPAARWWRWCSPPCPWPRAGSAMASYCAIIWHCCTSSRPRRRAACDRCSIASMSCCIS
jgi:hypothetical protein